MVATSRGSENGEADEGEGDNAWSGHGGEDISCRRKPLPPLRRVLHLTSNNGDSNRRPIYYFRLLTVKRFVTHKLSFPTEDLKENPLCECVFRREDTQI